MKKLRYEYFRDLAQVMSFFILTFSLGAGHIFSKQLTMLVIIGGFAAIGVCATFMTIIEITRTK